MFSSAIPADSLGCGSVRDHGPVVEPVLLHTGRGLTASLETLAGLQCGGRRPEPGLTGGEDVRQVRARHGAVTVSGGLAGLLASRRKLVPARGETLWPGRQGGREGETTQTTHLHRSSSPPAALNDQKQERNLTFGKCPDNIYF